MDKLAREAMLAKQAGMSYGKWKAMRPVVKVEKKLQEGWRHCEWCGKAFKKHQRNQRFCEFVCQTEAYQAKIRKEKMNEAKSST